MRGAHAGSLGDGPRGGPQLAPRWTAGGRRRRPGSSTAEVDLIPPAALQPACTALQCGVLLASQPVAPPERERGREREETDADADGSGVLCESSVTGVYVRERGGYGAGAAAIGRPREERSRGEEDKAGRHTAGRGSKRGRDGERARGLDGWTWLVLAARWLARTGTARPPEAGAVLLGGVPLAGTSRRRGAWPGLRTSDTRGTRETVTKPGRIIESHARQCKMRSSRFAVDLLVLAPGW